MLFEIQNENAVWYNELIKTVGARKKNSSICPSGCWYAECI